MKIAIYFTLLLSFTFNACLAQNKITGAVTVTANEFESKLHQTKGQLIDVRTPFEYKNHNHLKGAKNVDFNSDDFLKTMSATVDKNKPVFVYCASGGRSGEALKMLSESGFKEVYNLKDGINGWKKAGKSVE
jgi:rhodanese-related sulfurtransferase